MFHNVSSQFMLPLAQLVWSVGSGLVATTHTARFVSKCYYRENNSADYSYFYLFSCFHHDTQVNPGLLLVSLPLIHHYVHKSTYLLTYYTIFHDVIRNCVISNINKTDLMTVYTHHDCQKGGYYLKKEEHNHDQ